MGYVGHFDFFFFAFIINGTKNQPWQNIAVYSAAES